MGDIDGWKVNGKTASDVIRTVVGGADPHLFSKMMGEIWARGGSWVDRHCLTAWLTSQVFQTILVSIQRKLLQCFASPVRDLVFIVMDRFFFFIPVYLYSSAYKLIINTPTCCYAGCSRGCPAAFKHQTRLSLSSWTRNPTASKIRVNM